MTRRSALISIDHVCVTYVGAELPSYALQDISIDLYKGTWTSIIGANGSGKSTLSKIIAGLSRPTKGKVTKAEGTQVHIVMQNPERQILGDTIYEEMSLAVADPATSRNTIRLILDEMGLPLSEDTLTEQLSGGEKQLLNIASAMASGANVFILDEVTSMLDPASRDRVMLAIQKLSDRGATIVWLTHRTEELVFSERIILLDHGQVSYDGSTRQFLYGDSYNTISPCEQWGMELPYVVQVAKQLEQRGYSLLERPMLPQELSEAIKERCQ